MCGIVGIFKSAQTAAEDLLFVQNACKSMEKRGPDATGFWTDEADYSTGFVRLAIRDRSPEAHQPMVSPCENYVLSYNGELYNCAVLQEKLVPFQVEFQTHSDTEVLLYSLIHLGVETVLSLADGMFAFAFYRRAEKELILARDRAGIKPLYLGFLDHGVIYSSDYKHIVQHPAFQNKAISEEALGAYLQLGFIPDGMGFLKDTQFFPHGHYLRVNEKERSLHCFWAFPAAQMPPKNAEKTTLSQHLTSSVSAQMISDVPLGTFLSGGVDSPLVAHAAAQKHPTLSAFTLGLENHSTNEVPEAAFYAQKFGVNQQVKYLKPEALLDLLEANEAAFSEPFADYSSLPTLVLSALAHESVTVALSGDGADELFWGYARNARMAQRYPALQGSSLRRNLRWLLEKVSGKPRKLSKRDLGYPDFVAYAYSTLFISGALKWVPKIFKGKPGKPLFLQAADAQSAQAWPSETEAMQLLRKLEFDLHLQRILLKVDRASMHHSLEVRVPFLSNEMIDFALEQPHQACIVDGSGKYPLKAFLSEISQSDLAFAQKKGFTIPLAEWIRADLKAPILATLQPLPAPFSRYFRQKAVDKMLQNHLDGQEDAAWMIWSLYTLVRWHQKHCTECG